MKSRDNGEPRSGSVGRALSRVMTLVIAVGFGVVGIAGAANATHPSVKGDTFCDTATGVWSIKWTVGGDTAYPNATATIKSQSLATNPTLVGKSVKNTQTVNGTQTGTVAASTTYTQTVKVQFDTHQQGSLVTQTGSVTTGKDCKQPEPAKVTICHRTASYTNPYVVITVAQSAVDGNAGNDNGQGDHYLEHRGPVFYPTIPQGTEWGDIIPPIAGVHNGYNWTAEGQAVYNNGCAIPDKKVPVPAKPGQNDPCGPNNATWIVPNDTDSLDWTLQSDGRLTVATKPGFKFEDGTTSKDYGKAVDSNEPCKVPVPAKPSYQDPCGPGNASWNVPADTVSLDWTLEADGDLVVATKPGYVFDDGSTSKNYGKAPDSGVKCTVPVPPAPTQNDPCGPNNASWNVPADTASYDWTLRPDGHLVVVVKGDVTFPDGSTSKDYGLPKDSNEPCKVPVPAKPGMNDPCGPNNATWVKPADTASVAWVLEADGDLVASTKPGYVFDDGTTSKNYGKAVDSNVPCPDKETPVPGAPSMTDPCGVNNATWNVPADTESVDWTLRPDGHLVAETKPGYVFTDGSKLKDFGVAVDSGVLCPTTPPPPPTPTCPPGSGFDTNGNGVIDYPHECDDVPPVAPANVKGAVKKLDKCESNNFFYVKNVKGLHYVVKGKIVREGVWLKTSAKKVVVKVVADSAKFVVKDKSRFVLRFPNNESCNPVIVTPPTGA